MAVAALRLYDRVISSSYRAGLGAYPVTTQHPSAKRHPPADGSSRRQIRIVLFTAFGGLLVLLCILGMSAISFLSQIKTGEEKIREAYVVRDRVLQSLRSDIYSSGTHVRDFLLDTNDAFAAAHRAQFLETEEQLKREMTEYGSLTAAGDMASVSIISDELTAYAQAFAPVLNWNAAERRKRSYAFMQDELLPRRMSALSLADRIQQISEGELERDSAALSVILSSFRAKLFLLLILTIGIGLTFAGVALWRLFGLEKESQRRFDEVAGARQELKRLSTELVSAQESERRRISRELHDEVGQVLSAIVLGLGNLRSALRENNSLEAFSQLQLVQDMTERNASVVRNISLLLRPTMLDDLGLVPALKWLAREVSRTSAISVDISADSADDDLPEEYRTCVFRVVQEALRNAARHSGALNANISMREENGLLRLRIQDNGKGFEPVLETGLGILGMQERVLSLGGTMKLNSKPGRGTSLSFDLPLPWRRTGGTLPDGAQEISPLRTA